MIFEWKGRQCVSIHAVIGEALRLEGDEQKAFVKAFCASSVYARHNVGYCAGYYSPETAKRIWAVFETAHPIFGTTVVAEMTKKIVLETLAQLMAGHQKDLEIAALKKQLQEVEEYHNETERARVALQFELQAVRDAQKKVGR